MDEDEVERVARLLKRQGLAASFIDARKLAENIVNVRRKEVVSFPKKEKIPTIDELEEIKEEPKKEEPKQELQESTQEIKSDTSRFYRPEYDVTKETKTLRELMAEDAEIIYGEEQKFPEKEKIPEAKKEIVEEKEQIEEEKGEEAKEAEQEEKGEVEEEPFVEEEWEKEFFEEKEEPFEEEKEEKGEKEEEQST